jgi:hypothetical protein
MNIAQEKTSVLAFKTLFHESDIRYSNAELLLTRDMFVAGYFILLFDLTPDRL